MTKYVFLSLLLLGCLSMTGQVSHTEICVVFQRGYGKLDPSLADNSTRLDEIISLFRQIRNDSTASLTEVTFSGAASPEGRNAFNKRLSEARMIALENYVRQRVEIPDSIVTRKADGIAWELLARLVETSDMPRKQDALDVLRNTPESVYDSQGKLIDSRKKHLMDLHGGRSWWYMYKHFFPRLRNACAIIVTVTRTPAPQKVVVEETDRNDTVSADTVSYRPPQTVTETDTVTAAPQPKPFYMSVKTNMLYDLLALPTLGAEFYLGRNWSIAANWTYGWWKDEGKHRYWRAYGGDIAVRKWFGGAAHKKPLTGHHIGIYGQILTYDIEFGGKGIMGGEPGKPLWSNPSYAAGVEYGYSLPVADCLNIDFAIGVGYLGGKYYEYEPVDNHYVWQATKRRHWFGPTKAEITLVWLLGHGNRNERKGGEK